MTEFSCNHTLHWCRSCLGHLDREEVLNTHKLYSPGGDTTRQVFLILDANRKAKIENEPYASPQFYITLQYSSSLKHP